MQISDIVDDSLRVEVAIVFTRCGFENNIDEMYPWGYIGLINNTKPQLTQQAFNESLDMVLDSSKMMQKLEEIVGNAKKDALSEFGLDLGSFGINQPMLGWTDKNIAIVTTTAQYALEGELFTENNLAVKRPGTGRSPMDWNKIIGKTADKEYRPDQLIL